MAKRTITLGKWENKPLKWIVLKEENFGCLVIIEDRIGKYKFDESNKNSWGSSSLRKFLNKDFFDSAFTDEEKKKIVNSRTDNVKDNVFILTQDEVVELLPKVGPDPYEDSHHGKNVYFGYDEYRFWTRSITESCMRIGYAKGNWSISSPNNTYSVRPAMYIKEKIND